MCVMKSPLVEIAAEAGGGCAEEVFGAPLVDWGEVIGGIYAWLFVSCSEWGH